MKLGLAKIAVGTRTAVFAPFDNIGLIIIDEEQAHTYKSEMSPRYAASAVAKQRAAAHGAALVLSSATPALESYFFASQGRYRYHELPARYNRAAQPPVHIVDLRDELRNGNASVLSLALQRELAKNLDAGEQSILFINRRGYNTFVSCRACGYVAKCPSCGIAMTYHLQNNRLMCHYCGHSEPTPSACPECGSSHIRYFGAGTQKAQEDIQRLFPQARVLRMDADTTARKYAHDEMLAQFAAGGYDILLGTQMVTKGLDFGNVTLVGILAADASLYTDDFRANERTFSLITQATGRAGRGDRHPGLHARQSRAVLRRVAGLQGLLSAGDQPAQSPALPAVCGRMSGRVHREGSGARHGSGQVVHGTRAGSCGPERPACHRDRARALRRCKTAGRFPDQVSAQMQGRPRLSRYAPPGAARIL